MWDTIVIVMIFMKGRVLACYRRLWVLVHSVSNRQQRVSRFSRRAYAWPSVSRKVTFLVLWIIHSREIRTVHFWPSTVLTTALGIDACFWHGWVLQNTVSFSKMLFIFKHVGFHSHLAAETSTQISLWSKTFIFNHILIDFLSFKYYNINISRFYLNVGCCFDRMYFYLIIDRDHKQK